MIAVIDTVTGSPIFDRTYRELFGLGPDDPEGRIRDLEFSRDEKSLYFAYGARGVGIGRLDLLTLEVDLDFYRIDTTKRKYAADLYLFSVSPDARFLFLSELRDGSAGTTDKFIYDRRDGKKSVIPLEGERCSNLSPRWAWSPDSTSIVLAYDAPTRAAVYEVPANDPTRPRVLVELSRGADDMLSYTLGYSPRGRQLLYATQLRGVILRHLDTGTEEVIAAAGAMGGIRRAGFPSDVMWSRSGRFIVFSLAVALPGAPVPYHRVYVYDNAAKSLTEILDLEHHRPVFPIDDPATIAELWPKMEPIPKRP
jgi:hypothetical protein